MTGVSLIVPTYERVAALRDTLPSLLAAEGVDEILFIDDGSADGTRELLDSLRDPRVRVVHHARRLGLQAARNGGLAEATGEWIVFGEDDVRLPRDYVTILRQEAAAYGADIVGAPFVLALGGDEALAGVVADARRHPQDSITLDQLERFPAQVLHTPFLPAPALVHRTVVDAGVRFDEGYRGNAYREETAFFCEAVRRGFTSILTPRTFSYQAGRWQGGGVHTTSYLRYELWTIRNTWRFLGQYGRWLHEQGLCAHPLVFGARFTLARVRRAFARAP